MFRNTVMACLIKRPTLGAVRIKSFLLLKLLLSLLFGLLLLLLDLLQLLIDSLPDQTLLDLPVIYIREAVLHLDFLFGL